MDRRARALHLYGLPDARFLLVRGRSGQGARQPGRPQPAAAARCGGSPLLRQRRDGRRHRLHRPCRPPYRQAAGRAAAPAFPAADRPCRPGDSGLRGHDRPFAVPAQPRAGRSRRRRSRRPLFPLSFVPSQKVTFGGLTTTMLKKAVPFLSLLLAFILLTACGQNAANEPASSPSPSASPAAAGRIASMSIHITNNLLALGLTPAGSVVGGDVKDFLPHVKDRLEGVQKLGVVTEPDMEAVLALKPDSIFIDETYSGPDLAKFEQIAPTVSINPDKGTWKDHLRELAGHVGRQQQAEDFILDYDKQKDEVGALIKSRLGADAKVMAVRMTAKELRVMGMKRPVGPLLYDDLGLQPADGVEKIDKAYEVISQEVLPDFDADAILVIVSKGSEAKKNYGLLESNPLWKSLKAVQNKHVYVLDGQKWLDYSSLGHKMALDDAAKLFAE
ncbi:hypothetical protein BN871_GA_00040 [Paenibacillus sp. P22]|nr:hypothetical protein BN871_GA_00040 [Paenibacillus sp. P22]